MAVSAALFERPFRFDIAFPKTPTDQRYHMTINHILGRAVCRVLILIATISCGFIGPAGAYDAKSLTIKVGYGAGGSYDGAARLVARHIGRFLPGNPEVIVQNVPGGGSMKLMQLLLGAEPVDGSVIGAVGAGIAYAPILDPGIAPFDPLDLGWIGSLGQGENMCVVNRSAKLNTIDAFKNQEFLIGASGRSSSTYLLAALARNALGAKFRIVTGFDGVAAIDLAMQRGEIAGHCVASSGDMKMTDLGSRVDALLRFGNATIVGHETVPRLGDLIADANLREASSVIEASVDYEFPFVAPLGTSEDTVKIFRRAFDAMVASPEFIADAGRIADLVLRPTSGGDLTEVIGRNIGLGAEVFDAARALVK